MTAMTAEHPLHILTALLALAGREGGDEVLFPNGDRVCIFMHEWQGSVTATTTLESRHCARTAFIMRGARDAGLGCGSQARAGFTVGFG